MDIHYLPKTIKIGDIECPIKSDYRDILYIFQIFNDKDLLNGEKVLLALENFYETEDYKNFDLDAATKAMMDFLAGGKEEDGNGNENQKPLYDWEQDFSLIVAPINRVLTFDVRDMPYLHWWTFLSAFMEIGECTFNTFVGIRNKLNKGIKLDKTEEKIYKENKNKIILKKKYDSTTQSIMDEIMGKGV